MFGARKFVAAIDDGDIVLFGETDRVLNCGIACADNNNFLVFVLIRIVELVLAPGLVGTRHVQPPQVAL